MRMMRLAPLACTAAFVLAHLSLIAAVRAQAPNPSAAEKDKATAKGSTARAGAPAEPSAEIKAVTQAILDEIDKNSQLMANLEYLCDMIGPRLTGSPNLTRASSCPASGSV